MITTIDKYKDSIFLRFDQGGDTWGAISKLPHYKDWTKILNHLKKRGFEVKTPKTYSEQNWGIHTHKVAYKENVVFCLEMMGSQIKVEFGDVKNLWQDWEYNFWSLTDRRSKPLSYLESKKIELEVRKLLNIFPKDLVKNHVEKLTPTQKILKDKYESCHSHKKEKLDELGLDGIVFQMNEYDHSQNSKDKNGKKINCGELKYFYNYDKRLKCGIVYHSLNNRWMVLTSEEVYYVSDYDLFDFDNQPRRKALTKEQKINRLESELKRYENKKNYIRCISINKQIEKLKSSENTYHVWSLKWNKWWGANNSGYTEDKRHAGVYLESNILADQSYYNDGVNTKAVKI
jgi:hypothetical protein